MTDTKQVKSTFNSLYGSLPTWAWNIYCFFRTCKNTTKRLITWFPVIWKDRDWDEVYLYEIMRFKISLMRQELDRNQRHVGCEDRVLEMKRAEYLLGRIGWNNTDQDALEGYRNWCKKGLCQCPEETTSWEELPNGCHQMHFHYCDFCKSQWERWFKWERDKMKFDMQYTFKYIAKHSPRWWD